MIAEIKKVIVLPILWIMVLIFLIYNCFMIHNRFQIYENLNKIHQSIVNQTLPQETIQRYTSMYDNLDMMNILEMKEDMFQYHPNQSFQHFLESNYQKLQQRVIEIKDNQEKNDLFYPGDYYQLHTFLYKNIFSYLIIEIFLLTTIITLYIMDYERLKQTQEVIYSSQIGKRIQKKKAFAGLLVGLIFGSLIMIITLSYYFNTVSYQDLWHISISSAMASVPRGILYYPFITFFKLTVLQYLVISIILSFILIFITEMMVIAIQFFFNNSYLSFLGSILFLLLFYYISSFQTVSWLDILLSMNPSMFWFYCGTWLIENEIHLSFNGYEIISLFFQALIILIFINLAFHYFLQKDIKS